MAINLDFRDFYVKSPDNPSYNSFLIEEDDIIQTIIQRYELLIFSNKGDLIGDPNFGTSLEDLLYNTNVPSSFIVDLLKLQINDCPAECHAEPVEASKPHFDKLNVTLYFK